jgi:hypothetical protein
MGGFMSVVDKINKYLSSKEPEQLNENLERDLLDELKNDIDGFSDALATANNIKELRSEIQTNLDNFGKNINWKSNAKTKDIQEVIIKALASFVGKDNAKTKYIQEVIIKAILPFVEK